MFSFFSQFSGYIFIVHLLLLSIDAFLKRNKYENIIHTQKVNNVSKIARIKVVGSEYINFSISPQRVMFIILLYFRVRVLLMKFSIRQRRCVVCTHGLRTDDPPIGTRCSRAECTSALANKVLPVPEGPCSRTARGTRTPGIETVTHSQAFHGCYDVNVYMLEQANQTRKTG
jgi:hypothetical protein